MAEWVLKYADPRGEIHSQVAQADSEKELRERYTQQGYLIYSVRPRHGLSAVAAGGFKRRGKLNLEKFLIFNQQFVTLIRAGLPILNSLAAGGFKRRGKLNLEKFLIFNQQFVTLIRAGLPILKSLDLLAERLTDAKLGPYIKAVRDEVRTGTLLSDAFRAQSIFPKIYVTSVMAGEKSGSLTEVLDRYIAYQKLALAVRKKVMVSLMYPSVLLFLTLCLIVFLVTYVVPNFASLYASMQAELPAITQALIAVGTTARNYILVFFAAVVAAIVGFRLWSRRDAARAKVDAMKLRTPVLGEIWLKYQVAQFSRVLSTLLAGGIPLVQGLDTASDSLGTPLLAKALNHAGKLVREGQSLSGALKNTGVFPALAIDMIEVGESTGALPAMLTSVAEFYEEDVNTRMTAAMSLIEPAIMIFMGIFVAFVLIALYLPIFSLAEAIH